MLLFADLGRTSSTADVLPFCHGLTVVWALAPLEAPEWFQTANGLAGTVVFSDGGAHVLSSFLSRSAEGSGRGHLRGHEMVAEVLERGSQLSSERHAGNKQSSELCCR